MTTYRPNSIEAIDELFAKEGDELVRANFVYPNLSDDELPPEGFERVNSNKSKNEGEILPSPIDEANRLGIDVEKYLEG